MTGDRYTIISADGHAGGDFDAYRRYLDPRWLDEFDAWEKTYVNPFADLLQPTVYRNFDNERRLAETESDGIVAEILFPNTVPPFFDESGLVALPPTEADYDRRWAGLQAHNRWMADFCAAAPGRRAACVQVFVNRIDDALAEIRWAKDNMSILAGLLLPNVPPNSVVPPLWEDHYEPLWELCEELDIAVHIHGGSGSPDYGEHEAARAMLLIELPWFSHRSVWHLIFSGVLERHPSLRVVLTEQGVAWLPRGLETLDWFYRRMTLPRLCPSTTTRPTPPATPSTRPRCSGAGSRLERPGGGAARVDGAEGRRPLGRDSVQVPRRRSGGGGAELGGDCGAAVVDAAG